MATKNRSRLTAGVAISGLLTASLFIGSQSWAAPRDRLPPTTPTNLVVTARTDTSISVSWNGSTDDSGRFSYKVRINNLNNSAYNSLATVSQSQTTYTAKFLPPSNNYSFSVYAVDAANNRSGDSNSVNTSTLADTTPPTTPNLEASVVAPSRVQLVWTKSTDNVANHCCSYDIMMNGSQLTEHINWAAAPDGHLAAVIRRLSPATTYTFSISVRDWSGNNVTTSNVATVTTTASDDTTPPTVPGNLHLVRDDGCAEVWLGWNEATDDEDSQSEIEYEIYVGDELSPLPVSAGVDMDFVYGTEAGDNFFYIRAVDRSGNVSAPSAPIRLYLWPC
jgi:predicted phage tail protein